MFALKLRFAIFIIIPLSNGELFTQNEESDVIAFVENVMNCRKIPGMNLAVVKGNKTWTRGFGLADVKTGRNATNETLFVIGSLGKSFTMTLLGNFIQDTRYVTVYITVLLRILPILIIE